jgi:uncharacterized tellurite resistance protein B-like protein
VLKKIQAFFAAEAPDDVDDEAALHLAAAMLLIEVAKSDHVVRDMQIERLKDVLRSEWALDDSDLSDLLRVARDAAEAHASLHEQIALINGNFSVRQKFNLVRGLWEVAYANGELHHHEELLIRRLADLMHVSHTDFIRSKHLVLESRKSH